jgi:hypothetical protein
MHYATLFGVSVCEHISRHCCQRQTLQNRRRVVGRSWVQDRRFPNGAITLLSSWLNRSYPKMKQAHMLPSRNMSRYTSLHRFLPPDIRLLSRNATSPCMTRVSPFLPATTYPYCIHNGYRKPIPTVPTSDIVDADCSNLIFPSPDSTSVL